MRPPDNGKAVSMEIHCDLTTEREGGAENPALKEEKFDRDRTFLSYCRTSDNITIHEHPSAFPPHFSAAIAIGLGPIRFPLAVADRKVNRDADGALPVLSSFAAKNEMRRRTDNGQCDGQELAHKE